MDFTCCDAMLRHYAMRHSSYMTSLGRITQTGGSQQRPEMDAHKATCDHVPDENPLATWIHSQL